MKTWCVRFAVGVVLLLVAATYAVRAQEKKSDILLQIVISKNGSVVAKPTVRVKDGTSGSVKLDDGTQFEITASAIPR